MVNLQSTTAMVSQGENRNPESGNRRLALVNGAIDKYSINDCESTIDDSNGKLKALR